MGEEWASEAQKVQNAEEGAGWTCRAVTAGLSRDKWPFRRCPVRIGLGVWVSLEVAGAAVALDAMALVHATTE